MLNRASGSAWVVRGDARDLGEPPVDGDEGLLLGQDPDRAVRDPRAREQHTVDRPHLALGPVAFEPGILLGVRKQDGVRGRRRLVRPRMISEWNGLVDDDQRNAAGPRLGQAGQRGGPKLASLVPADDIAQAVRAGR